MGDLAPWLSERCPVTYGIFLQVIDPTFVQEHGVYWRSSLIRLQAKLKALTGRLIVIYDSQPIIFGQLMHLRKLSKEEIRTFDTFTIQRSFYIQWRYSKDRCKTA